MILNVKANFDQWNYNGNFDTWIEVSNTFWCCFGCYDIRGGFNSFRIENKIVKFGLTLNHHCVRISIKYVKGTITIYHKYNDLFTTILVTITKYFSVNNLTNNDDKQHRWYKHNRRSMIYYSYWVFFVFASSLRQLAALARITKTTKYWISNSLLISGTIV